MGNNEVLGFYTTRWVKADNPESAEQMAVDLIRNDPTLKEAVQNQTDDQPMIFLEELVEVGWLEFFRRNPGSGFTFYPNDSE